MDKIKKLLGIAAILIIASTTALAGRVELGALIISNNFTVTGTSTIPYLVIGGVEHTNIIVLGTSAGNAYDAANGVASSNLAASALSTNGGTMGGTILTGTNAVTFGTNNIAMYGGVLDGTNGVYWNYNLTNYWLLID